MFLISFARTVQFRLGVLLCLSVGLTDPLAADEALPQQVQPIEKATGEITVDGKLDEPAWKGVQPVEVNYIYGQAGKKASEPRMQARYLWDDHYLYLGYETFDENLVAVASGETDGPAENRRPGCAIFDPEQKVDVVEFFISFEDPNFFWEVHHNAANQFNDIWCTVIDPDWKLARSSISAVGILFGAGEHLRDDFESRHTLASGAQRKADGSGYTGEMRIPWFGLGAPVDRQQIEVLPPELPGGRKRRLHGPWKMAGVQLRLLAVFQNGDLPQRYHHSSPSFSGGWFHKGFEHWPQYVLGKPEQEKSAE